MKKNTFTKCAILGLSAAFIFGCQQQAEVKDKKVPPVEENETTEESVADLQNANNNDLKNDWKELDKDSIRGNTPRSSGSPSARGYAPTEGPVTTGAGHKPGWKEDYMKNDGNVPQIDEESMQTLPYTGDPYSTSALTEEESTLVQIEENSPSEVTL